MLNKILEYKPENVDFTIIKYKDDSNNFIRIANAFIEVTKFTCKKNFAALVMSGKSSFITKDLFQFTWHELYKKDLPKIFDLGDEGNHLLHNVAKNTDIASTVFNRWPKLEEYKKTKISYLDEYIRQGTKLNIFRKSFANLGFDNIYFTFVLAREYISEPVGNKVFIGHQDDEEKDNIKIWGKVATGTMYDLIQDYKNSNDILFSKKIMIIKYLIKKSFQSDLS